MRTSSIIDCHTHCFPPEVALNVHAWANANKEEHWLKLVASEGRPSIQGWATEKEQLTAMDQAGIEKAVLLGWYWENEATCRWHNEVISRWQASHPDRFIGFATIYPGKCASDALRQLQSARDLGLCGIGELHSGIQDFDARSAGWMAVADWCVTHDWPVNLHATEATSSHPDSCPTPLEDFVVMAKSHPNLKLILAHWGGGLAFCEHNPRLRKVLKNVYYDTAASPLIYEPSIFRAIVDSIGKEKVLFGSDYPLRLYPKQQKHPDFLSYLESIRNDALLSEDELDAMLGKNMQTLLGL